MTNRGAADSLWRAARSLSLISVLLVTLASVAAAADVSLCVMRIEDAPGVVRNRRSNEISKRVQLGVESYFMGSRPHDVWIIGPDHRRHVIGDQWRTASMGFLVLDKARGSMLTVARDGLNRIAANGDYVRIADQPDALAGTRAMSHVDRLAATLILTSGGLWRYSASNGFTLVLSDAVFARGARFVMTDMPFSRRVAIAIERQIFLMRDDETIERIELPLETDDRAIEIFDAADGSGALVFSRKVIWSLRPEHPGRSTLREIFRTRPDTVLDSLWHGLGYPYFSGRAVIRTPDAVLLSGREGNYRLTPGGGMMPLNAASLPPQRNIDEDERYVTHPNAPVVLSIGDGRRLVVKGGAGAQVRIEGLEAMRDAEVRSLYAMPQLQAVVVSTNEGLFEVRDTRTLEGGKCVPAQPEPVSAEYCTVPIALEGNLKPRQFHYRMPSSKGYMLLSSDRGLYVVAPGARTASVLTAGKFSYPDDEALAYLRWRDAAFVVKRLEGGPPHPLSAHLVERGGRVVDVPRADGVAAPINLALLGVAEARQTVYFSGYATDGVTRIYWLDGGGRLATLPLDAVFRNQIAIVGDGEDVLVASSEPIGPSSEPPGTKRQSRHDTWYPKFTRLWRVERDGSLAAMTFPAVPPTPEKDAIRSKYASLYRPPTVSHLYSWPSRKAALIATSEGGLFTYSAGEPRFIGSTSLYTFMDMGPDRSAVATTTQGAALVRDDAVEAIAFERPSGGGDGPIVAQDPAGRDAFVGTASGLFRIEPEGKQSALIPIGHPAAGEARFIFAPDGWGSILALTPAGLRVVGPGGKVQKLGGNEAARRHHDVPIISAGRLFLYGNSNGASTLFELVRRRPDDPACEL